MDCLIHGKVDLAINHRYIKKDGSVGYIYYVCRLCRNERSKNYYHTYISPTKKKRKTEEEKIAAFHKSYIKKTSSECWVWKDKTLHNKRDKLGYGVVWSPVYGEKFAHRIAYRIKSGNAIPKNLVVRHICDNSLCVNPNHLEVGTQLENVQDMIIRGRANFYGTSNNRNRKLKSHCNHGHLYSPENTSIITYSNGRTQRRCKECKRYHSSLSRAKSRFTTEFV